MSEPNEPGRPSPAGPDGPPPADRPSRHGRMAHRWRATAALPYGRGVPTAAGTGRGTAAIRATGRCGSAPACIGGPRRRGSPGIGDRASAASSPSCSWSSSGSIVTATATVLSHLGPVPVVIAVLAIVAIAASLLRGVAGAARDLDAMLAATRRVEEGDYGVRLGSTRSDLRPDPGAGARLRHDGRPAGGRRGAAANAAGRRQPRAADAAGRDHRQPRGDRRRRLSTGSRAT